MRLRMGIRTSCPVTATRSNHPNRAFTSPTWRPCDHCGARRPGNLSVMAKVQLSEDEWRKRLTPEEYLVLRQAGTERPFTGEYTDTKTNGTYKCRACGADLFRSDA